MRVVYTTDALADLERILAYIEGHNPAAAAKAAARIDATVADIALFPLAARLDPQTGARERPVRKLPLLIVYTVSNDLIEIAAIFHTSRDPAAKPGR